MVDDRISLISQIRKNRIRSKMAMRALSFPNLQCSNLPELSQLCVSA
jgi:hypothetical protein